MPKQPKTSRRLRSRRFPQAYLNCGFKFTPITCTITIDESLV